MVETCVEAGEDWNDAEREQAGRLVDLAARACEEALRQEGWGTWLLSLTLTSRERVHALNRAYRHVDAPTDVLSFSQREGDEEPALPDGEGPRLLGDVVVALEVAREQAEQFGHSVERETTFLAVHGTLHLLGYDHEDPEAEADMMTRTERALGRLGLVRTKE